MPLSDDDLPSKKSNSTRHAVESAIASAKQRRGHWQYTGRFLTWEEAAELRRKEKYNANSI